MQADLERKSNAMETKEKQLSFEMQTVQMINKKERMHHSFNPLAMDGLATDGFLDVKSFDGMPNLGDNFKM